MKMSKKALATAIGIAISGNANATLFTVTDNILDPSYISGTQNGTFDISSVLLPSADYNAPYVINSAAIIFSFSDDSSDSYTRTSSVQTSYVNNHPHFYRTYDRTTTTTNQYESVSLGIAGATFSEDTNYFDTGAMYQGSSTNTDAYWYSCSGWCTSHYDYYHYTYDDYIRSNGYTGDFLIAEALDVNSLNDLINSGSLDFTLDVTGDIILNKAELVFDIEPNPIVSSVPEPGIFALISTGLIGVYAASRRKKTV